MVTQDPSGMVSDGLLGLLSLLVMYRCFGNMHFMELKNNVYSYTAINTEIKNLLEMFEFYLMERQLGKPVDVLAAAVRDLRIIIQRLLIDYFIELSPEEESRFCSALASLLAGRTTMIPKTTKDDKNYFDYCIGEILTCFQWAQEIKSEFPQDAAIQKTLLLDIPILRPFDYGVRSKIRVVKPVRRKASKTKRKRRK